MMKKTIIVLTLLLSANAFADDPAWWSDSKCRETRNKSYASLMLLGFKSHDAIKKIDEEFKTCICWAGDETRMAVQSLVENHEIEMMSSGRILTVPIQYGRDFGISISGSSGKCYLDAWKPEICKNAAFMSEAEQSFRVYHTYDEKLDLCVFDFSKTNNNNEVSK
ncbi:hypothetical protein [Pseudomonas veronii]